MSMIRPEVPADHAAVHQLNRRVFGQDAEAVLVDALREGGYAVASLVAEVKGTIVGHILFCRLPIRTATGVVEAVSLAPLAVLPEHQRRGIGTALVRAGLEACRASHHRIAVVLGHPDFYLRFGFSPDLARRLESPFGNGEAWMAIELVPGALDGVEGRVEYPPPFAALG